MREKSGDRVRRGNGVISHDSHSHIKRRSVSLVTQTILRTKDYERKNNKFVLDFYESNRLVKYYRSDYHNVFVPDFYESNRLVKYYRSDYHNVFV